MVAELLEGLTARHGACRVVAYADLSARMVLVTNAGSTLPRERLNALCAEAARALTEAPMDPPDLCDAVLESTPEEIQLFLRLPHEPSEALICLCDPGLDLGAFVDEARVCLAEIAAPEPAPEPDAPEGQA